MKPLNAVLIVDDAPSIRQAVRKVLSVLLDCRIDEACNGEDGLAMLRANHYDAVVLDVDMPGRSGTDICRDIRGFLPDLPILIWSVRDTKEDRLTALKAGADDYIAKPIRMRDLVERVREAVCARRESSGR